MRSIAAAFLAMLAFAALAQQPGMRARVMMVESLPDFERWAQSLPSQPYSRNLTESVSFVTEVLALRSFRSARRLTGEPVQQNELSLTASLRKRF